MSKFIFFSSSYALKVQGISAQGNAWQPTGAALIIFPRAFVALVVIHKYNAAQVLKYVILRERLTVTTVA
jgi:hypothetical protein